MSSQQKLTLSLPHLQNQIKRDPDAYREDFKLQYLHFESQFMELTTKPDIWNKSLAENIAFVSQVAYCYPEECKTMTQMFMDILRLYSTVLNNDIRLVIVRALILMRNRGLIECVQLCELFFLRLLRCQDRLLRVVIQTHIVSDIKKQNEKHQNLKLNSTLQNFMCTIVKDNNAIAVKMALDIMIDLYRKNVWNDKKSVNIIASTCFSKIAKVQVAALNFFLGTNQTKDDKGNGSDSDDDDKPTKKEILLGHRVGNKTAKRKKKTERALRTLAKQQKKKKVEVFDFSALHLLYDAQDFTERLFRQLETSNERFEVKLLHQDLISRLIGLHHLLLLNFYPYIQRYLQPHQRQVTKILLFVAQAAHEVVPPDILESVCKTIANNFITERNSGEVMAVGLNTIREICSRSYLAMNEDLLHDLSKYKSYRDKSVSASARSLIQVFREKNPHLLERKDRGKPTEFQRDLVPLDYGQSNPKTYLEGAELLVDNDTAEQEDQMEEENEEEKNDDNKSEDGWINVSDSDDDEEEEEEEENDDKTGTADVAPMTEEERRTRAINVSSQRILTQREFEQLRVAELKRRLQDRRRNRTEQSSSSATPASKKRKTISIDTDSDDENAGPNGNSADSSELISLKDIERVQKKRLSDKESRLETVLAGREGRAKFGKWKKEKGRVGLSNKEKLKNKNFMMIKPKMKQKQKRSFRDKQIALRDSLLKDKRLR